MNFSREYGSTIAEGVMRENAQVPGLKRDGTQESIAPKKQSPGRIFQVNRLRRKGLDLRFYLGGKG